MTNKLQKNCELVLRHNDSCSFCIALFVIAYRQ